MTEERRREERRESAVALADIRAGANVHRVKVRNVSSGGAMVEGITGLVVGEPVALNLVKTGWVEGHVAWVLGDRLGIAFSEEIDFQ